METQESERMKKQERESTRIEEFTRKKSKESGGNKRISKKRILLQSIEDKIKELQCSNCQTDFRYFVLPQLDEIQHSQTLNRFEIGLFYF